MRRIFRTHRSRSGATRVRPHRLRHTYGTELATAGADLLVLRGLMGHASAETTAAYVHLSETPRRRVGPGPEDGPMSALATRTLREAGAPDVLAAYAVHVQELAIGPDAKRLRRHAAKRLLAAHPVTTLRAQVPVQPYAQVIAARAP